MKIAKLFANNAWMQIGTYSARRSLLSFSLFFPKLNKKGNSKVPQRRRWKKFHCLAHSISSVRAGVSPTFPSSWHCPTQHTPFSIVWQSDGWVSPSAAAASLSGWTEHFTQCKVAHAKCVMLPEKHSRCTRASALQHPYSMAWIQHTWAI